MISFLLIVSMLVVFAAIGILVRAVIVLGTEVARTARSGTESVMRIKGAVAGIREEEGRLCLALKLLSGVAASWSRAEVLPGEVGLLVRNIRSLGTVTAMLSTLRKVPW